MAQTTVKTRILIMSDTHTTKLAPEDRDDQPFREPLPEADVLLHCGDLTMVGHLEEYEQAIDMLGKIDAELKLVVAGNHDISLDAEYYSESGKTMHANYHRPDLAQEALRMWKGPQSLAHRAGIIYLEEGLHTFRLKSGAVFTLYASPYQPWFCNWAFPYEHDEDRYNPRDACSSGAKSIVQNPIPDHESQPIDILMTHGPPLGRLDKTAHGNVGCPHLLKALTRSRPRLHCFGHIHEGWGAERVSWKPGTTFDRQQNRREGDYMLDVNNVPVDRKTVCDARCAYVDISDSGLQPLRRGEESLLVNASIMDLRYRPSNAPWLVDMELPLQL